MALGRTKNFPVVHSLMRVVVIILFNWVFVLRGACREQAELVHLESQALAFGHVLKGSHPNSWYLGRESSRLCSHPTSEDSCGSVGSLSVLEQGFF